MIVFQEGGARFRGHDKNNSSGWQDERCFKKNFEWQQSHS